MSSIDKIKEATMSGQRKNIEEIINQAINAGLEPQEIIQNGFILAMNVVGKGFQAGELFIPEMLMAAKTMATGMEVLKPLMIGDKKPKSIARVVLGTVKGDMHDIGKNLVATMMESVGIEVIDLGIDVSPEKFVDAVKEHTPQIVAMSALLTTTMKAMEITIKALKEAQIDLLPQILVGGAPVSADFAEKIGADGYAENAGEAADLVIKLVS